MAYADIEDVDTFLEYVDADILLGNYSAGNPLLVLKDHEFQRRYGVYVF